MAASSVQSCILSALVLPILEIFDYSRPLTALPQAFAGSDSASSPPLSEDRSIFHRVLRALPFLPFRKSGFPVSQLTICQRLLL